MIDMVKVCYSYEGGIRALDDINLHVGRGESVAFIGPNGCGKSTLMKMINGLVLPRKGSYFLHGEEITAKKMRDQQFSKSFHKKIGFVFQNSEAQLFCSSVYDEIAFGLRQMGMAEDDVKNRVEDVMALLSIRELRDRVPYHLSGGEKKKVAIASVIALNPEIYVFDEPMNGLDARTKRFIRNLMVELNRAGKSILCSTHDFEYVKGVFERAVVISENHTIVRDGAYDEILQDTAFLFENNII